MSSLAKYLGAGDVVARYGVANDDIDPNLVETQLDADPGLGAATRLGEGDEAPGGFASTRPVEGGGEEAPFRVSRAQGALVVDGTGAALPVLARVGLTDGEPPLLFSPALTEEQLGQAMADGGRLVLTDSNLRREASNTQANGFGPVLPSDVDPGETRALYGPEEQTTAVLTGNAAAEHRGQTWSLGMFAYGGIEQAFDGDPSTAWRFGHFQTGVGHAAVITPDEPHVMHRILLHPQPRPANHITDVKVTAVLSDRVVETEVELEEWRTIPTAVDLPGEPVTRLEIEVTGIAGEGNGPVGLAEIEVPGIEIGRVLTLSDDLSVRAQAAARTAGVELSTVPMDVIFERSTGDASGTTAEEASLIRTFALPDERSFDVEGTVRLAAGTEDWRIDLLAGAGGSVRANSSSRLGDEAGHRASRAIDGTTTRPDLTTGWSPKEPVVGEWISVDFPRQRLDSLTITQSSDAHATEVLISVDDGTPFPAALQPGETVVNLPEAMEAGRVRVLITARSGTGPVIFHDLGLPRIRSASAPEQCQTVGWLDNRPLRARVGPVMDQLLQNAAVPFELCTGPFDVEAGDHNLAAAPGFALDLLHLSDTDDGRPSIDSPPDVSVDYEAGRMTATLDAECEACWVSVGQAVDSRWTASLDGKDLGPATVIDGYAAGWRIEADAGDVMTVEFAPQRAGTVAWLVSGTVFLFCVTAMMWVGARRWTRNRRGIDPEGHLDE